MIENFNNDNKRSDDVRLLLIIITLFLFVIWLCTPPGNKLAQMCLYGNNTKLFIAKISNNSEIKEYKIYRNNAIYEVRMGNKDGAFSAINKAIVTAPSYISQIEYANLYKDRAEIRLFYGDYKGALGDFLRQPHLDIMSNLKVGLLYKELGNDKEALAHCNQAIMLDSAAYAGFSCMAEIYGKHGKFDTAVRLFDLLIDRSPNNAYYYYERAEYKQMLADFEGYEEDMRKALELSPSINSRSQALSNIIHPKSLALTIN